MNGSRKVFKFLFVDRSFYLTQSCDCSVPTKHTKVYINNKLLGLFAQVDYYLGFTTYSNT